MEMVLGVCAVAVVAVVAIVFGNGVKWSCRGSTFETKPPKK
jgi:hypothetical protein